MSMQSTEHTSPLTQLTLVWHKSVKPQLDACTEDIGLVTADQTRLRLVISIDCRQYPQYKPLAVV